MSDSAFAEILAAKPAQFHELAWAARALIFDALPNATEIVWIKDGNATYGTSPIKSAHGLWIGIHAKHVTIGFYWGLELPDPDHLLVGVGKRIRHVELKSMDDLNRPGVRRLVEAAVRYKLPPPENEGPVSIRRDRENT
jgi:hypothetical protein